MREIDRFDMSRADPGDLDRRWRLAIAAAWIVTIAIVAVSARLLNQYQVGFDRFWFRNTFALVLVGIAVLALVAPARLSRSVRLAVLLPVVHLVSIVVAWRVWLWLAPKMPSAVDAAPLFRALPVQLVVPALAAAVAGAAAVVARPRRREWIHAATMIALVFLLLLGLWLPVAAATWFGTSPDWQAWETARSTLPSSRGFAAWVAAPPFAVAVGFAALALRRSPALRRDRAIAGAGAACLLCLFAAAVIARGTATSAHRLAYLNYIHVLFAAAVVAIAALIGLAAVTWAAGRRARRRLAADPDRRVGIVAGGDAALVAGYQRAGWLRGPRPVVAAFELVTPAGIVPVPPGAQLATGLPRATTMLRADETAAAIRCGDRIAVAGFIAPPAGHPFRVSTAPVPGPGGLVVGPLEAPAHGLTDAWLGAWRPCIAYLGILIAVAIPALAAAYG